MSFALDDEQRRIVETVRKLTTDRFRPGAADYMDGSFPWENIAALAEVGVLGMAVPEEYGGSGLGILETALVLEEIAKGCYVTAMAALGEVGTQTRIIAAFAPEEAKARLLPAVSRGECILAICMTEPDAGTDLGAMRTSAVTGDGRIRLDGVKTLISRAEEASAFVVFARIDHVPGTGGVGCVLVEKGTPGLFAEAKYHTMGGERLAEVRFEGCELPAENLLVGAGGLPRLLRVFNTQRCLNASISLGLAEGAFEESAHYMRDRPAFGRRIGDFQGMRWKLADMYREIESARGLLYRACTEADPYPDPVAAALAKIACNEMSIRVTNEAVQIHGGYGFVDEFPVSRHYRCARYGSLGGGTSEALRNLVGRHLVENFDPALGISSVGAAGLDGI